MTALPRYRTLVADDEPLGREGILTLLARDPEIEVVATCADGVATRDSLLTLRPDVAFLDIQMPAINGLSLLSDLPADRRPASIFVTAYDRYAVAAFDACAVDYLVKPFREARFRTALAKAKAFIAHRRTLPERMAFKVARGHVLLDPRAILWIEAAGDGIKVCEGGEVHPVRETLRQAESRLQGAGLLRVHRSFLVNPAKVRRISPLTYGEHELLMSDGAKIRVGRAFRDHLKTLLAG